ARGAPRPSLLPYTTLFRSGPDVHGHQAVAEAQRALGHAQGDDARRELAVDDALHRVQHRVVDVLHAVGEHVPRSQVALIVIGADGGDAGLLRGLKGAQARVPRGARADVHALGNLGPGQLLAPGRVVPGAHVGVAHVGRRVDVFRAGDVARNVGVDERNVHAAHDADDVSFVDLRIAGAHG